MVSRIKSPESKPKYVKKLLMQKNLDRFDKSGRDPLSHEEARNHIIERAANLFAERRYDQVTLDDLISILGIGKGTLYRYFTNKAEIYSRILEVGHENLLTLLAEVQSREDMGPSEKLHEIARSMAHFIRLHQDIYTVMAIEEPKDRYCRSAKMLRYRKERIRIVASVVDKGQHDDIFRADFDSWLFAQSLMGAIWVEAIFPSSEGNNGGKQILRTEEIVSLFLHGIQKEARNPERDIRGFE